MLSSFYSDFTAISAGFRLDFDFDLDLILIWIWLDFDLILI